MNTVDRPQAAKKKIHSKDQFELCYLRHQYLRKCTENPTDSEMEHYSPIVVQQAKKTFFTYYNLFQDVGMELEDVVNIGKVHIISFIGLFTMEKSIDKLISFEKVHEEKKGRVPTSSDILNKNKANFTMFLKQRFGELVRICRQKSRNIKGLPSEEFYIFCGKNGPPKILRNLLENSEKMGFKKLDISVFKSIRKKANRYHDDRCFKFNDLWYVCVPVEQKTLGYVDFDGADMSPYDNIHNMSPEQIHFDRESQVVWQSRQQEFTNSPIEKKIILIKSFIVQQRGKRLFREEVRTAKELLKALEIA